MLTLTESQWLALQQADAGHFVIGVADQFLMGRPEMLDQPGRTAVVERMRAAHHYADGLRFTSPPHIVRLMYLAADAPRIHDDRPGVGWMIYLPLILSVPQVPEARALVPVRDQDDRPLGTIVVSVVDGAFSETDPEHLRIAQAIETRLVDQDFLPRYESL